MQGTAPRCVILIALLALGQWLLAVVDRPRAVAPGRWPIEDAPFAVEGWAVGPAAVESAHGVHHVVRRYARPDGPLVTLGISTSPEAKRLYRGGADVAFLGAGYTTEAPPPGLVPSATAHDALLLRRGNEGWLMLSAYGERRGLLGNGARGWGLAALDGVLGRPNDYFLLRVVVSLDGSDAAASLKAAALADILFPRLAAWYAG